MADEPEKCLSGAIQPLEEQVSDAELNEINSIDSQLMECKLRADSHMKDCGPSCESRAEFNPIPEFENVNGMVCRDTNVKHIISTPHVQQSSSQSDLDAENDASQQCTNKYSSNENSSCTNSSEDFVYDRTVSDSGNFPAKNADQVKEIVGKNWKNEKLDYQYKSPYNCCVDAISLTEPQMESSLLALKSDKHQYCMTNSSRSSSGEGFIYDPTIRGMFPFGSNDQLMITIDKEYKNEELHHQNKSPQNCTADKRYMTMSLLESNLLPKVSSDTKPFSISSSTNTDSSFLFSSPEKQELAVSLQFDKEAKFAKSKQTMRRPLVDMRPQTSVNHVSEKTIKNFLKTAPMLTSHNGETKLAVSDQSTKDSLTSLAHERYLMGSKTTHNKILSDMPGDIVFPQQTKQPLDSVGQAQKDISVKPKARFGSSPEIKGVLEQQVTRSWQENTSESNNIVKFVSDTYPETTLYEVSSHQSLEGGKEYGLGLNTYRNESLCDSKEIDAPNGLWSSVPTDSLQEVNLKYKLPLQRHLQQLQQSSQTIATDAESKTMKVNNHSCVFKHEEENMPAGFQNGDEILQRHCQTVKHVSKINSASECNKRFEIQNKESKANATPVRSLNVNTVNYNSLQHWSSFEQNSHSSGNFPFVVQVPVFQVPTYSPMLVYAPHIAQYPPTIYHAMVLPLQNPNLTSPLRQNLYEPHDFGSNMYRM